MPSHELPPRDENRVGRSATVYTPDTLRALEPAAHVKFFDAVDLLRASIEELRDMNGVETTDDYLTAHEIIYPAATSTVPTLRLWDDMLTRYPDRTPFLLTVEDGGSAVAVCEGRIYPFLYNKDQVEAGGEQPVKEKAIFIEQTGVKPAYRGNKEDNVANKLYSELYSLAAKEDVTLLIGAVNVKNGRSRSVVERQGRQHIATPPLDNQGNPKDPDRYWPHPQGAYLPNPVWEDTDTEGNPIHVVLEYYTQRLGPMPET